jgi:putative flavoprotein involved in K+ transport
LTVLKKVLKIVTDQSAIFRIDSIVDDWLCRFNAALHQTSSSAGGVSASFVDLFHSKSFWRDALALSWQLKTIVGETDILNSLPAAAAKARISAITLDPQATAPRLVTRAGSDAIEAFFTFTTDVAHCRGILRLNADDNHPNQYRAWTFFTAIDALIGFEEKTDRNRPTGQSYSRDFRGPNWLDKRLAAASYETHDPAVLVVGGGQAG